ALAPGLPAAERSTRPLHKRLVNAVFSSRPLLASVLIGLVLLLAIVAGWSLSLSGRSGRTALTASNAAAPAAAAAAPDDSYAPPPGRLLLYVCKVDDAGGAGQPNVLPSLAAALAAAQPGDLIRVVDQILEEPLVVDQARWKNIAVQAFPKSGTTVLWR